MTDPIPFPRSPKLKDALLRAEGIAMAHDLAFELLNEIIAEHDTTPSVLGFSTRQHQRLLGGARALRELNRRLKKAHAEAIKRGGEK